MIVQLTRILLSAGLALPLLASRAPAQLSLLSPAIDEREAQPRQSYEGVLVIRNDSPEAQEVRLYQTDYAFTADGRSLFGAPGSSDRSNARWLSFGPDRLVIPPRETARVVYRVDVPTAPAELTGTFWSVVMVEPIPRGSTESSPRLATPRRPAVGLNVAVRYATQIVTHMGISGSANISYDSPQVTRNDRVGQSLSVNIANVGNRAHRLDVVLEMYDAEGRVTLRRTSTRGLVYPGSSIRQSFDVGTPPPGTYTALIITDAGRETAFGAQYAVRFGAR